GAVLQARRGHVLWGAGAVLGLGGILAAPFGARIGSLLSTQVSLLLFAALMAFIGLRMLLRRESAGDVPLSWIRCERRSDGRPRFSLRCAGKLFAAGALTGILSGIFGVGGGFLVVPALLVVTCVSIERALATSLVGIFLIAVSGFAANAVNLSPGDAGLAGFFLLGSAAGMTGGAWLKQFLPAAGLQRIFGLSVLGTAVGVIVRNL
ncbi:MAG TPA: sulfite exporter TauE/SafE family protein, partial [Terrimicrobiaceae bacterium]|nr:sulfite exporter TauE/SafE family protein [Terrimicrobiaceae bacterium]